jgi:phage replication-related protein YjqB (UPF0714/DUF867 family)
MKERRITSGDRRARALQLKPSQRQNNAWSRNFTCSQSATMAERLDHERIGQVLSRIR